jgi:hypothetical protein
MGARSEAIVTEIEEYREAFERWCRSLSEEELTRPVPGSDWQVKDFISHLATIDRTVATWFQSMARGGGGPASGESSGRASDSGDFSIDTWNNAQVAKRRDWPLDQIFDEARETRAVVIDALRAFTDEQLEQTIAFGGDSKRAPTSLKLGQYLSGWAKHDPIHVNDMIRALPERRQDPDVSAWLDDPTVGEIARGYARQMGWTGDE